MDKGEDLCFPKKLMDQGVMRDQGPRSILLSKLSELLHIFAFHFFPGAKWQNQDGKEQSKSLQMRLSYFELISQRLTSCWDKHQEVQQQTLYGVYRFTI